jgi:ABC-type transport system involved in multi-copper enzyme maturation permease subunit
MTAHRGHVLSGAAATVELARVTFKRTLRQRTVWGAACVAGLPLVLAAIFTALGKPSARGMFEASEAVAAILVGLTVAGAIGEEVEERTMTYLWSRPLPRWSLLTGKLLALVPLTIALGAGGAWLAMSVGAGDAPVGRMALAIAVGLTARAGIATAFATLVPRQALALTVAYLFFIDLPLAIVPARLQVISIVFHEHALAMASDESLTTAVLGLAVIALAWLGIALWRIRRLE